MHLSTSVFVNKFRLQMGETYEEILILVVSTFVTQGGVLLDGIEVKQRTKFMKDLTMDR